MKNNMKTASWSLSVTETTTSWSQNQRIFLAI